MQRTSLLPYLWLSGAVGPILSFCTSYAMGRALRPDVPGLLSHYQWGMLVTRLCWATMAAHIAFLLLYLCFFRWLTIAQRILVPLAFLVAAVLSALVGAELTFWMT